MPVRIRPEPTRKSSHGQDQAAVSGSLGLGDVVAKVAKPVAKMLGRPTDCLPCQQRQAKLNAIGARVGARVRKVFGGS